MYGGKKRTVFRFRIRNDGYLTTADKKDETETHFTLIFKGDIYFNII